VDRSSAEGALVEVPKARRGRWGAGRGIHPLSAGEGSGKGARPLPQKICLLFDLKMEHFGSALKLNLTEETRTQLQRRRQLPPCLILADCDADRCGVGYI